MVAGQSPSVAEVISNHSGGLGTAHGRPSGAWTPMSKYVNKIMVLYTLKKDMPIRAHTLIVVFRSPPPLVRREILDSEIR